MPDLPGLYAVDRDAVLAAQGAPCHQRALRIEVVGDDALAGFRGRDGERRRQGRLAGPALLNGHGNDAHPPVFGGGDGRHAGKPDDLG